MLKGFYGRYYNNIADSFTGSIPAAIHRGVQLPRPEPQRRYDGPSDLGTQRLRAGGASTGRPGLQDAVRRGDQRVVRDPAARRVLGARDLRAQERRRCGAVLRQQPGYRVARTATCRVTGRSAGETFNLVDVPDSFADEPIGVCELPRRDVQLRHDRVRLQQAGEPEVLHQCERRLPVAQRLPLVAASNGYDISTSPLSADPIGINFYVAANPAVPHAPGDHGVPLPVPGALRVPGRDRVRRELPVPERVPVLRIIPDCGSV